MHRDIAVTEACVSVMAEVPIEVHFVDLWIKILDLWVCVTDENGDIVQSSLHRKQLGESGDVVADAIQQTSDS